MRIALDLNGAQVEADVEPSVSLADLLRTKLGALSVHLGCEQGVCGACAVLVDGRTVRSCLMLAVQGDGRSVTTAEGVPRRRRGEWAAIESAFVELNAFQCGFCTSGMVVALEELLSREAVTRSEVAAQLSGQICRCTGYAPIVEAFERALASSGRLCDGDET